MITIPSCWMIWRTSQHAFSVSPFFTMSMRSKTLKKVLFPSQQAASIIPLRQSPTNPGPRHTFILSHGKWSNRCFLEGCGGWKIDFLAYWGVHIVSWKLCHVDYSPSACLKETLHLFGRRYVSIWNYFGNGLYSHFQIKESDFKYQKTGFNMIQSPKCKILITKQY